MTTSRRDELVLLVCLSFLVPCSMTASGADWIRRSSSEGHLPVPNAGDQQTCCLVLDVDQDGIQDFVVGERTQTPSIVWYRSTGTGWERFVIDDTRLRPEAGGVSFDVDGDGDEDIIFGQDSSGSHIWWWENPRPDFSKSWVRRTIKVDGARKHHDQTVGDFDGDGRLELVSWNQGAKSLLLLEIPEQPRDAATWPVRPIYSWTGNVECEGFPTVPPDIDLDGQIDIVGGGSWFKHKGDGTFEAHVIDETMRFTQCAAGQLVRGGRPEVVFSPGDADGMAKWYEWKEDRWQAHDLRYVIHGHTCEVGDIDRDGNLDILIGEMGSPGAGDNAKTFVWFGDGRGNFRETVVSTGQGIHEGKLGDLDGDGDLDILMKPYHHRAPRIDILLNNLGK